MAKSYEVTAPLVQVRRANGGYAHVYEGGLLPADADEDHVAVLLEEGMIVEGGDLPIGKLSIEDDDRPGGNASLDEWHAYALAHGQTDEDLEGKSRNEIRDLFS